jgi:hypothetical protein
MSKGRLRKKQRQLRQVLKTREATDEIRTTYYGLIARVAMQLGMYAVKGSSFEGGVLSS